MSNPRRILGTDLLQSRHAKPPKWKPHHFWGSRQGVTTRWHPLGPFGAAYHSLPVTVPTERDKGSSF